MRPASMDDGWEARMAALARARRATQDLLDLDCTVLAARTQYITKMGDHVMSSDTPRPEIDPDICRGCFTWRPIGNWPGVFAWALSCKDWLGRMCDHAHHDDEHWVAA